MSNTRFHSLSVESVVAETADAVSLNIAIPETLKSQFQYKPGQFLTFRLPVSGGEVLRCYSMSSTPELEDHLRVTVKRVVDGRASNWICDHVKPGDALDVMKPAGVFTPKDLNGTFLLFAGGSGITPVLSILRAVLKQGRGTVRLIYANRDEASIIFKEELKSLLAAYPSRLDAIHLLDSVQGIPSQSLLANLARGMENAQAFICGPGPYMDAAESALLGVGMSPKNIHVERFVSLPDETVLQAQAEAAKHHVASVDQAEVVIDLYGTTVHMVCAGDESILQAAQRQDIELPYSCEAGMCASCMCEVSEGEVELLHNDVLDQRDLDNKMTLTCQARPLTTNIKLRYL